MADSTTLDDPLAPAATQAVAPTTTSSPDSLQAAASKIATDNAIVPLTNDYDESKGVAGRVASITADDAPLMQQARTQGTQAAAARGLTNSSLAGQAEQAAVLGAATPIATSDASLYSQNSLANLAAKNQAAVQNSNNAVSLGSTALQLGNSNQQQTETLAQQQAQFNVSAGQSQQQIDNQIAQFAQQLGLSTSQLQLSRDTLTQQQQQFLDSLNQAKTLAANQNATQLAVAQMSSDTQKVVASTEAQWHEQIQGSANISAAWGQFMTNITNIQNNAALDQDAKTTLINNNIQSFQAFADFWQSTGGADGSVTPLLSFGSGGASSSGIATGATNPTGSTGGTRLIDGTSGVLPGIGGIYTNNGVSDRGGS